jgi:RNA polymerase sigma-70 factor (ECF subfamily)
MNKDRTDPMNADILMRQLKEGDLNRAGDLFAMYNQRLYNFFLKSTYDRDLSHDLTQTVFYRMIHYRKSFGGNHNFKSWIYQVARNVMADHFRKEKKVSRFVDIEDIGDKAESSNVPEESYKQLYQAMALLEDDQREILVMSKFQKMKYEDIALAMDTTVGNVKVKVYRAMQQLKQHYKRMEAL